MSKEWIFMVGIRLARTLFFFIGIVGLLLVILSFRMNTLGLGGVLCTGALIGHMATWKIEKNADASEEE
ncbi:hypothetical protein [Gleimia hominis]|uniref:hypothetical protein n=1 Tax=Gleimia hominis TaxID=595468 RepID=UPI001E5ABAD6|nr:hypothetical protein [Gleimia hominis]WIK63931.1 hypothetical protein CJ187_006355 [Gleimia hominis]